MKPGCGAELVCFIAICSELVESKMKIRTAVIRGIRKYVQSSGGDRSLIGYVGRGLKDCSSEAIIIIIITCDTPLIRRSSRGYLVVAFNGYRRDIAAIYHKKMEDGRT